MQYFYLEAFILAWENSQQFVTPILIFSQNDVWETSAEILYRCMRLITT